MGILEYWDVGNPGNIEDIVRIAMKGVESELRMTSF